MSEICQPTNNDHLGQLNKDLATGLQPSMTNFEQILSFIIAKQMLEPMRTLVSALQGELIDVYFGFQKIDEIISCYANIRNEIDISGINVCMRKS